MLVTNKFDLEKALKNKDSEIIIEGPFSIRLFDKFKLSENYIKKSYYNTSYLSPLKMYILFGGTTSFKIIRELREKYYLKDNNIKINQLIFSKINEERLQN
ncbi:hypothetical protein [Peptoniphilus stercorisuis]|uniref:Uncharacterized protein n=1 Tax=Peptoniphilus stercorisuis TaxID=1436965 RepID=A0ABS4KDB4_9FIRM|nr:hypothetical protein [Peptoniphilus stercorisuis]MBP2025750.1 hypothetical protein [Peptoniphilus stercorisuis]